MSDLDAECEQNNAAYGRLKEPISRTYAPGSFVGIADEQVVGAAADFRTLESALRAQGKDPRRVLVVQAGVDYPEYVTILLIRPLPYQGGELSSHSGGGAIKERNNLCQSLLS